MCPGQEKALEVMEPEPAEGEEEEGEGEGAREEDQDAGGAEEEQPSASEDMSQELPELYKPKMKLFTGKLAAGLRIRAEPSFLVSTCTLIVCILSVNRYRNCYAVLCLGELHASMYPQFQATSVGVIKPGESFTYTDEVHAYILCT